MESMNHPIQKPIIPIMLLQQKELKYVYFPLKSPNLVTQITAIPNASNNLDKSHQELSKGHFLEEVALVKIVFALFVAKRNVLIYIDEFSYLLFL
ncbi:hypothetical protein H5410_002090 [Solanum commersonii]|uniref:Uncharacterized protein n=1 Tax=Solanum commersonii TaxID=4109 RepID=A0A9J6B0N8_SOLCO|nr:hypothetical protein H5410_002090 [Solanum commersonii]